MPRLFTPNGDPRPGVAQACLVVFMAAGCTDEGREGTFTSGVSPTSSTDPETTAVDDGETTTQTDEGDTDTGVGTGETDTGGTSADGGTAGTEETDTGTTDPGDPTPCDVGAACGDDLVLDIGTMSGDQGSDMLMATGTTEAWVEFSITEDDLSALNGTNMSFVAQLASPPGVDFDLEGRRSNAPTSDPCAGTVTQTSQNPVGIDQIAMYWGEAASPNGEDDTRRVIMHVIPTQDTCQTGLSWTLTVVRG